MLLSKLLLWRKDQKEFIESLPGNALEHIRRAIDDYIEKIKRSRFQATISPSKSKKGDKDGRPNTYIQPTTE